MTNRTRSTFYSYLYKLVKGIVVTVIEVINDRLQIYKRNEGESMKHYSKKELSRLLDVTEATVTKYTLLFVKYDYEFIMDGLNSERLYTDKDLENFKQVIALKKVMKIEEAVKQIVKGNSVTLYNPITPQIMDDKLNTILEEVRFIKDENKTVKEELAVIKKELEEHKAIMSDRDGELMKFIRSTQETNKALIEAAGAKEPEKKLLDYIFFWRKK